MPRITDRYMCLGCGRFWRMPDYEIVPLQDKCPYCGDIYWIDNIQPDVPPPLFEEREIHTPCHHFQVVETFGDMKFCSQCGTELHGSNLHGETLKQWQLKELERLGI